MSFFFEVLIGGLLSGVMYSLVALGFVLIYKASGVFNFAQGAMVFYRGAHVRRPARGRTSVVDGDPATLVVMVIVGPADPSASCCGRSSTSRRSRSSWRPSGLTFFIEGVAQLMWGANVRGARARRAGRADRVADGEREHQRLALRSHGRDRRGDPGDGARALLQPARASAVRCAPWRTTTRPRSPVGIPLQQIWAIVWGVAGAVALVAGLLMGRAQRRAVRADRSWR
jgi:branched-chain amino acid transport system permease protein